MKYLTEIMPRNATGKYHLCCLKPRKMMSFDDLVSAGANVHMRIPKRSFEMSSQKLT